MTALLDEPPGMTGKPVTASMGLARILGPGVWALSAKFLAQIAQLATFIIAARILSPAEFGFFAVSSAVVVFLVVLSEGGWAEYILATPDSDRIPGAIVALALASGTFFTCICLLAAGVMRNLFGMIQESTLLALFSLWILPSALTVVYDGILVQRAHLGQQAVVRIVAELGGFACAVLGLLAGWNVIALVVGRLALQAILLSGSVLCVGWIKPTLPTAPVLRVVLRFSRTILANRTIVFLRAYSGTLVVGSFLGLTEAGLYRAAERVVAAFSELIGEPARILSWVAFRRARGDHVEEATGEDPIARAGIGFLSVLLGIAAPVYLGLALVSGNLIVLLLGPDWVPAALIVTILAAKQLLIVPGFVSEPLLAIRGAVHRIPPFLLFNGLLSTGLLIALAPLGIVAVALGQAASAAMAFALMVWMQQRYGRLDWLRIARNSLFTALAAAVMVLGVMLVRTLAVRSGAAPLTALAAEVCIGAILYGGTLMIVRRRIAAALSDAAGSEQTDMD